MIIERNLYLNKLIARKDNSAIKVITGMRRCGKSFLLFELYYNFLLSRGIDKNHIIQIPLDDDLYEDLRDRKALRSFVESKVTEEDNYYLFIDEVQFCEGFEGVLNGLARKKNLDIYVTGSNSRFLSSDIITEFRGRGDEVRVYPLSFSEFSKARGGDFSSDWKEYVTYGGLPFLLAKKSDEEKVSYLNTLLKFTYEADVVSRNKLRENNALDPLLNIVASSVGSLTNPKKLADTFKSRGVGVTDVTIKTYLGYLLDAFLIEKAERYDVKGKRYISTPSKYYFTDIGIRNAKLGFRQMEENHLMENIIYNELVVRGYSVDVGVVKCRERVGGRQENKKLEVDFVCYQGSKKYYIQSAYSIPDEEKLAQEQKSLLHTGDFFKKIIIVSNDIKLWRNEKGITIIGLREFLMNPASLDL
jgi:Predicted ATPase (AAA+ superfamily)